MELPVNVNNNAILQYVRIALYLLWGGLANYGINVSNDKRAMIASALGTVATLAWTMYGTRMNALLEQIKAKAGVQEITVKVDPNLITPANVNDNTSNGITAKAA